MFAFDDLPHACGRRYAHRGHGLRGLLGRRHQRWSRGFGGRRMLEHGDLRYVILQLLADRPRHGYEIIKAIEDRFGGLYSPSPGVIYPTLTMLEELGHATVSADVSGKKHYALTAAGSQFLAQNRAAADAALGRLDDAGRAYGDGPSPEMRRAVHDLGAAIAARLGRGPMTAEARKRFTEILDQAAAAIERS